MSGNRGHRGHHERDERGAVALVSALALALLVAMGAFVVDIGMQRVARRDMQSLADVVALDLSRELDGRSVAVLDPLMPGLAAASQQRNSGTIGQSPTLTVELGSVSSTGVFSAMTSGTPSAVRVTAATRVGFAFGLASSGGTARSAVGTSDKAACFMLGSYAAAVNSGDSTLLAPLNGLTGLNLSLLSYQGLAGATVSVAELVATGQVGTAQQFLSGNVTLGQLQAATLAALNNQSPRNTAAITALNAAIAATANATSPVSVPGVVSIDPTSAAALATQLNVLNLLTGAAAIANGTNAVAVNGLSIGSAGTIGAITVNSLTVTERPGITCGTVARAPTAAACAAASAPLPPGCAQNSQLRGDVTIPLNLNNTAVGSTFFKVSSVGAQLSLNLGNAAGVLQAPDPVCGAGTAASPDKLNVGYTTSVATANLVTGLHFETNALDLGLLLGKVVVKVDVTATSSIPAPPATGVAPLSIPPNDTTPVSGGSDVRLSSVALAPTVTMTVETVGGLPIIGATLGLVTTALNTLFGITTTSATAAVNTIISSAVNPLIGSLNGLLLGPLATLLGLDVAGADVYAVGRVRCTVPRLVG